MFWQQRRFPGAFASGRRYVNYPQYFAWRLCGVAATEMCSMGAHSDLWNPRRPGWSTLVERMGWGGLMAPLRPASDALAPLRPALAERCGLSTAPSVFCGIHDSSASLLPHLTERTPPFTVVSTGTWVIVFAVGGDLARLDPTRDTLANVTAFGKPVACARFMGGREFELIAGAGAGAPSPAELDAVLRSGVMALPTFAPGNGPFAGRTGAWTADPAALAPGERCAAASLYCALVTLAAMTAADASGPIVVEGPFAQNALYCAALAALGGRPVSASRGRAGTIRGAAMLVARSLPPLAAEECRPLDHPLLGRYAAEWRRRAAG
jgi:sugar (pentulose or hexulose) kinase